jgi:hypothetical protein
MSKLTQKLAVTSLSALILASTMTGCSGTSASSGGGRRQGDTTLAATAAGTAIGAGIGAAVDNRNRTRGALIGAGAGAITGAALGNTAETRQAGNR